MPELSLPSKLAFRLAASEAKRLSSRDIDSEHVFLGLCKLEAILYIEKNAISDIDDHQWQQVLVDIKDFRDSLALASFDPKQARRNLRKALYESSPHKEEFTGHRTQRCRDLFGIAGKLCKQSSANDILPQHLFAACLSQRSQLLDQLFIELSVDKSDLLDVMDVPQKANDQVHDIPKNPATGKEKLSRQNENSKTPYLDKYGRNLTQLAREGEFDPAIGRSDEIKEIARILMQKKKNNPILIGEAGVGKTAVVEGFALKIVDENAPHQLKNLRIIELNMGTLVAGTKYRGEFEERLEGVLHEASNDPNMVLFIDEIHTLAGAGGAGGSTGAANIMKPALARGAIKCIGATTTAEYRMYLEKDPALERRFQVIWVDEPSKDQTVKILKGIREKFEEHHGIRISDEVLDKAVELSMCYLTDFRLPDKAIDLLDQACARVMLKTFSPGTFSGNEKEELTIDDIARVVSQRCRIPVEQLTIADRERLLKIEDHLKQRVIGQLQAVNEVGKTIRSAKAGLKDPVRPVVFFFVGSTGTGKSELAKALSEFLFHDSSRLISLDMTEYQEKSSVAKLIGSPPGYIGYEEDGQLTGKIRSNPFSVILFDEIEKAHPDIFDIFLQIFDEGRLTDSHGRRVNFSDVVIILTSNLGSKIDSREDGQLHPMGFNLVNNPSEKKVIGSGLTREEILRRRDSYESEIHKAITTTFRPEFLNRIQKTVLFYPLDRDTVKQIISIKILPGLNIRLIPKGIKIEASEEALDFLLQMGYSESFGAREIQRIFERYITEPLSKMILAGEVIGGQTVKVTADINMVKLQVC
jgi:ATP-dependent Clp protease ATP-binding subunit ClpC